MPSCVIAACNALSKSSLLAAQTAIYFTNNCERMRYDRFRAAGYMIGSGAIESACKQIVTQRLKLPGAQWHVTGAVETAKARAVWLSGSSPFAPCAEAFPWLFDNLCLHTMQFAYYKVRSFVV